MFAVKRPFQQVGLPQKYAAKLNTLPSFGCGVHGVHAWAGWQNDVQALNSDGVLAGSSRTLNGQLFWFYSQSDLHAQNRSSAEFSWSAIRKLQAVIEDLDLPNAAIRSHYGYGFAKVVCALEPKECSTLFNNGRGTHRIEGIGDKMVTLIHNVLTTDYVTLIHDDDCVIGLELLEHRWLLVERILGLPEGSLRRLRSLFGISGICNILGAIRMAGFLGLGPQDNVVTIATDGFDRYPSVLANLPERMGTLPNEQTADWFERIFRGGEAGEILDLRPRAQKDRLFSYKEEVWKSFHYSQAYLDSMQSQSFWDDEVDRICGIDTALLQTRARLHFG